MRRFVGILALLLFLSACSADSSRWMILRYVADNQQELEERIEKQYYDGLGYPVQEVDVEDTCIEFDCGGAGFGPETAYWGFFYTETDDVYAIWCAPPRGMLTESDGVWTWKEPDGDNECRVEHICGHFYYYEASF